MGEENLTPEPNARVDAGDLQSTGPMTVAEAEAAYEVVQRAAAESAARHGHIVQEAIEAVCEARRRESNS